MAFVFPYAHEMFCWLKNTGILWTTLVVGGFARSHRDGEKVLDVVSVCVFSGREDQQVLGSDYLRREMHPLVLFCCLCAMWPPAVSMALS